MLHRQNERLKSFFIKKSFDHFSYRVCALKIKLDYWTECIFKRELKILSIMQAFLEKTIRGLLVLSTKFLNTSNSWKIHLNDISPQLEMCVVERRPWMGTALISCTSLYRAHDVPSQNRWVNAMSVVSSVSRNLKNIRPGIAYLGPVSPQVKTYDVNNTFIYASNGKL